MLTPPGPVYFKPSVNSMASERTAGSSVTCQFVWASVRMSLQSHTCLHPGHASVSPYKMGTPEGYCEDGMKKKMLVCGLDVPNGPFT